MNDYLLNFVSFMGFAQEFLLTVSNVVSSSFISFKLSSVLTLIDASCASVLLCDTN